MDHFHRKFGHNPFVKYENKTLQPNWISAFSAPGEASPGAYFALAEKPQKGAGPDLPPFTAFSGKFPETVNSACASFFPGYTHFNNFNRSFNNKVKNIAYIWR
ncbi:MAG: hypothetical protein KHZ93_01285 [Clostridiales bacterium]|nr:hypothetical protein [Clostridiales bacterium]